MTKKIPDRYSKLMCGWGDILVKRGKYYYTSFDDFVLDTLTMMCRGVCLGSDSCVILLYDNIPGRDRLHTLTVTQNEVHTAELLNEMKKDRCKVAMGDCKDTGSVHRNHKDPGLRAIYAIADTWTRCTEGRSVTVVFEYGYPENAQVIRVGATQVQARAWKKALDGKMSELNQAMRAAENFFKHKENERKRQIKLNELLSESEII